ncbi:hypothetical protein GP475_11825 [Corynebacterium poyangense]|uniref:Septum formation-related domain-containing protein n=1 Tax=Corynebacterium poyangense TaxID=2684405 RepID=A0A7H0SRS0_9CORY|nr:septum formation family protein [Corynebacterium poyangense]MBZ8176679.1 hypothetical protein [Corynebacterium poyangense]QNQ91245.1 hypothetical protein GP475_11825 [Corynebacterium poyangense]
MTTHASWRSAAAIRTFLVASLAGIVAAGSYTFFSEDAASLATHHATGDSSTPFTTADTGSCLTWDIGRDGQVSGFEQANCQGKHRFEVASREDLAAYPSSEFGEGAAMPSLERQAQLREELCRAPALRYVQGKLDPTGRYSIAPILPPAEAWAHGDRTMLCGFQSTDDQGNAQLTTGKIVDQDQARVAQPGECLIIDEHQTLKKVDCAQDHNLETTSIVNVQQKFPDHVPTVEEQDDYLKGVCTQAGMDYLGGDDPLYASTLQPYWTPLSEESWNGGSHSVNCALATGGKNGFAVLRGSAKGQFTIDGNPPAPQPERPPRPSETP